ncbi:hypothetical protein AB0E04_24270 [Streptomyces sp. NPDC048251]|uniref:hypothetical protein n=1 Tax=Streptomyces sp. NPDC048251 TaxID=3154501 RepID=UPI00342A9C35
MSQQYPQQPHQPNQQQPGWGGPQTPPGYAAPPFQPLPPKKPSAGKIIGLGCAGVIGLFVVIGIIGAATSGGDSTDNSNKDKAVAATGKSTTDDAKDEPAKEEPAKEENPVESTKTQAEEFQACVAKSGTPTEQAAIKHVTKVTGADKRNNILDAPEVFTDFSGGLMGPHQGEGKLIASAFTSCYESDNGLVTVYDKNGEILANANY